MAVIKSIYGNTLQDNEARGLISALDTRLTTAEGTISTNTSNISTNTSNISALDTRLTTAESNISTNADAITALGESLTETINTKLANLTFTVDEDGNGTISVDETSAG